MLHIEEVGDCVFNAIDSNMDSLEAAINKIKNQVWKDIYAALLKCRQNILLVSPEEYTTFQINGKPDITDNHCGIQQHWSKELMLHHMVNDKGDIKNSAI